MPAAVPDASIIQSDDLDDFDPSTIDFSDLERKFAIPPLRTTFDNIVVVDNAPCVDSSKEEKLLNVMKKIFKNMGTIVDIRMPKNEETGKSKGYLFIEFENVEQAELAIRQANGYKMDKTHILAVFKFDMVETYADMSDEYEAPKIEEFKPKEHLKAWLSDPRARDQWAMMKGDEVSIFWNNKSEVPDKVESRMNWSDMYVSWSPKGSYLATYHKQGIALWGGPSWEKINRFAHQNAKLIDFSPNEKYLVTWSHEPFRTADGQDHNIIVWDIATGRLLRSFAHETKPGKDAKGGSTMKLDWPIFKWSFDGKYLAKMTPGPQGMISVYETPSMGLLDKKSIKIENLQGFEWSPSDHILSYWTPENGNIPARVTLMKLPSREIIRTKNLFSVVEVKMFWQSAGDYMLIKVERSKSKKQTTNSIEVFRMREKDIPVDTLDLDNADNVSLVSIEPKGNRFIVLYTEENRSHVRFYQIESVVGGAASANDIKLLKATDGKGINNISWSPQGRFVVLAGVRGLQGDLQFWDTEDLTLLGSGEHYMCTDLEWDPTGRYLVSYVSFWRVQTDTGFILWTFTGQQLAKQNVTAFKQFLWRPRPETLLSAADQKKIRKKLRDYSKEFDEEDARISNRASAEVQERRRKLWKEWKEYKAKCQAKYESTKPARIALFGYDPDDVQEDTEETEEWIEELVEEKEELV